MPVRTRPNPFYVLLMAVGVAFVVTAFAYVVMAFQAVRAPVGDGAAQAAAHPLLAWMQRHGNDALLGELALLGVLTVAAIAADPWWERRSERRRAMRDEVIDHENSSRC